jgi:hypothetical protein
MWRWILREGSWRNAERKMPMSRIKRVGLSLVSAFASELLVVLAFTARDPRDGVKGILALLFAFSIFVVPGWLLSLPMVLIFDRIDRWRLWVLAAFGASIGPLVIFVWALVGKISEGDSILYFSGFAGIALVVGVVSTALYLGALRHFTRGSIEQAR